MCLNQIKIMPKYNKIYYKQNKSIYTYVKCGKCSECRREYTRGLMLRAYYEMKTSKYVLFDTLTYSENKVKWRYGIRVINKKDYVDFLKRLRKKLDGLKIRYLLSGEYGTAEDKTHRPHYHLLLFVKDDIEAITLSKWIKKKWNKGITDGIDDKGKLYFLNNRIFDGSVAQKNVVGYICKYMNKATKYDYMILKQIARKVNEKYNVDAIIGKNEYGEFQYKQKLPYEILKEIIRKKYEEVKQFVKWSKGFGEDYFELRKKEEIEEDYIKGQQKLMVDYKNQYPMPLYYIRKLLYKRNKELNEYQITEYGDKLKRKKDKYVENKIKENYIAFGLDPEAASKIADYIKNKRYRLPTQIGTTQLDNSVYWTDRENGWIIVDGEKLTFEQFKRKIYINEDYEKIINAYEYDKKERNKKLEKHNNYCENEKKYK